MERVRTVGSVITAIVALVMLYRVLTCGCP